jgi:DinB superfamily
MRKARGRVEKAEREFLLRHLAQSRERLLEAVEGLSKEQQRFRPAAERWSVADCLEHVSIVEKGVLQKIRAVLLAPSQPHVRPQTRASLPDEAILTSVPNRSSRLISLPETLPGRRWADFAELLRKFETARERSLRFAAVTQSDLRGHSFAHPQFGELDCYQWLLFLAAHSERHARQAGEVIAHPNFPRAAGSAIA